MILGGLEGDVLPSGGCNTVSFGKSEALVHIYFYNAPISYSFIIAEVSCDENTYHGSQKPPRIQTNRGFFKTLETIHFLVSIPNFF